MDGILDSDTRTESVANKEDCAGGRDSLILLPTRSEGHEVLQTGSILLAILRSCQFIYNSPFQVH